MKRRIKETTKNSKQETQKLKMAERGQMYINYKKCKCLDSIIKKTDFQNIMKKKMKLYIKTVSKIHS